MTFEKEYVSKILDQAKKFSPSYPVIANNEIQYSNFYKVFVSVKDVISLVFRLIFNRFTKFSFIYTGIGLYKQVGDQFHDRILDTSSIENVIYINRSKDTIMDQVSGFKVYNIGGMVKGLSGLLKFTGRKEFNVYFSYKLINDFILGFANKPDIYSPLFYNLNGLSLVFSKHRKNFKLIEVQHGSMINFPTYSTPSTLKIADVFFVKNQETIAYLKQHLNQNFSDIQYELLAYPKSNTVFKEGKYILYASTVEFSGIHPVFLDYLTQIRKTENVTVFIRLHPREKNKIDFFKNQVKNVEAKIIFDESKNWLESNTIKNLIVVSPWSSVIEDAADNKYKAIIIDELGKKRFEYLIDHKNVIYANDVTQLLEAIHHDI
jgi:hypothetical protein